MTTAALKSSYIHTLTARLELLLPNRTGYHLVEVELNPHFMVAANLLLLNSKRLDGNNEYFSEIINSLIAILRKINFDLSNKLIERDLNALTSSLIMSKLLVTIVSQNLTDDVKEPSAESFPDIFINLDLLPSKDFFEAHESPQPHPLHLDVHLILETLFALLSPRVNRLTYSRLKRKPEVFTDCDFSVASNLDMPYNLLLSYMAEIDYNLVLVIRYVAAANPEEYLAFVKENLLSWPDRGGMIPSKSLLKYSCLLMFAYTNPQNTNTFLQLIYKSLPHISSNTWLQIFLYYACINLENQNLYRSGFYTSTFYSGSPAEAHCRLLFDFVSTAYEDSSPELLSFFSWFAFTCASDFDEIVLQSHKIKLSFNKRLKFLTQLIKSCQNSLDFSSFECLNKVFLLGAHVESSLGGVREFGIRHVEETYQSLLKFRPNEADVSSALRYRKVLIDTLTAALLLHPRLHVEIFYNLFQQTTRNMCELFQNPAKTHELNNLLNIIKETSKHQKSGLSSLLMGKINQTLQKILLKTTELLCEDKSLWHESLDTSYKYSLDESTDSITESSPNNPILIEDIHKFILELYAAHPSYYLENVSIPSEEDMDATVRGIVKTVQNVFLPLEIAITFKSTKGSQLFKTACFLTRNLLSFCGDNTVSKKIQCVCILISHEFLYLTCEVLVCLGDKLFKEFFIEINNYCHYRYEKIVQMNENEYILNHEAHYACGRICGSVDKLLVLSLCTHKVQFLSLAKSFMKLYFNESLIFYHKPSCFKKTLLESFQTILDDNSVFSGYVSLNKRFNSLLINSEPSQGLYEAWLLIHRRWLVMIEDENKSREEGFSFKKFSEFLVCTSGVLLSLPAPSSYSGKDKVDSIISDFFDKAIDLLHSNELYIRVVIRDALSAESASEVYTMTVKKLMNLVYRYKQQESVEQKCLLFLEEAILVLATMISLEDDYSLVLTSLFPGGSQALFDFVPLAPTTTDQIKLKLRLCKMMSAISLNRTKLGLRGAHQLRNIYAKTAANWLSAAIFVDDATRPSKSTKTSDVEYLKIELATECSKSLELQLQSLVLVVPDDTKEANYIQAKEQVFSEYFALFYQILENFNSENPAPLMKRSKFKTQAIVENILKAISNILKANSEVGMQFALPLGYHGNTKMRAIFLEIFAATLTIGENNLSKDEFPAEVVQQLSDVYPIYGAAAQASSPAEHNLLATSLHGLFGYTMALDKLFITLLDAEMNNVPRSSEIFRSNSTLTRLMSIFAKEYGLPYLTVIVRPFIEDMIDENVTFEVERGDDEKDSEVFIDCLQRLVDSIVSSMSWVPDTFKFICSEIYKCISKRFEAASLIGVGSFLFLRFFCPAIVSPESFFDLTSIDLKVKRSLMQLVKVIQYMANGSISNLKWVSLAKYAKEMEELNVKIFKFMEGIARGEEITGYQFHRLTVKPLTSLRYIHKFLHFYYLVIRHNYVSESISIPRPLLEERLNIWRKLDKVASELGHPKLYISLQGTKSVEPQLNIGNSQFAEFMAKMSAKNIELSVDTPAVHTSVFHDGTPTIVVNFRYLRDVGYDMNTFVYLLFECISQVWEKKYYCVFDLSEYFYMGIIGNNYVNLIKNYAPTNFYQNFRRAYYYNLPRKENIAQVEGLDALENFSRKVYFYSEQDSPEITNSLCLDDVSSMRQDVRLVCESCRLYDDVTEEFKEVTIKLGRQWLQIWFKRFDYKSKSSVTDSVAPVETHLLADVIRCEVSSKSGEPNEFTLFLSRFNYQVTLVTPRRQEILRFLYICKLKATKQSKGLKSLADGIGLENLKKFSMLSNLMFHGLLNKNEELRLASSKLVASFLSYYGVIKDFPSSSVISVAFSDDTTEYVVQYSTKLAENFPQYTYMFVRSFFDEFEKLPLDLRIAGISYLSPWIDNLSGSLYREKDGGLKLAYTIRHLAKITTANKKLVPFFAAYIWRKLFEDRRITSVLVDELVSLAMENVFDPDAWSAITSLFCPGVEICGELIFRLNDCILKTKLTDSEIAIQSKQLEIKVLVKICASLFFNSYIYSSLYLLEVFLFCTLFMAGPSLDIGLELQRLVLNTIQSFSMKPLLNHDQRELINNTLNYFSSQRAKMLFGLTAKEKVTLRENSQSFDKAQSLELLFEHLEQFIEKIGSGDDKRRWMSRWSSLSKDLAFGDSFYCDRALSVVCTLARSGISDSSGGKILALMVKRVSTEKAFFLESPVSFYRLERGFAEDSVYRPSLLWSILSSVLVDLPFNYQAMTTYLGRTLRRLCSDQSFFQTAFEKKQSLYHIVGAVEENSGVRTTQKNYELVFLILISKGLALHRQRHCSIANYELILEFKGPDTIQNEEDFTCSYLLMYYLSVTNSAFLQFIEHSRFKGIDLVHIGKDFIPEIVLDQIRCGSPKMNITFLMAAYIFATDCDQIYRWKFISLYTYISKELRMLALTLFHIIQDSLQKSFNDHISITSMSEVSRVIESVIEDEHYAVEKNQAKVEEILHEFSLQGFEKLMFFETYAGLSHEEISVKVRTIMDITRATLSDNEAGWKLERY